MKLLKWTDSIKETISSKEEILRKAEKAEIACLLITGLYTIMALLGLGLISVAPVNSRCVWSGIALIIVGGIGYLEATIKGYLKLERYKAMWDKIDSMENELRQMQAKDL